MCERRGKDLTTWKYNAYNDIYSLWEIKCIYALIFRAKLVENDHFRTKYKSVYAHFIDSYKTIPLCSRGHLIVDAQIFGGHEAFPPGNNDPVCLPLNCLLLFLNYGNFSRAVANDLKTNDVTHA